MKASRHSGSAIGVGLALLTLALFLFWPLAEGIRGAFVDPSGRVTFAYVAEVLRNPLYREGFRNALGIAVGSTTAALLIGGGLAVLFDRCTFPGRRWLRVLIPLPLMVPPFVGAVGVKQLLGTTGSVNAVLIRLGVVDQAAAVDWLREGRVLAVIALTALHLYPIVYLNVSAALARINVEAEEAARSLGCRGLRLFRAITLPAILPSVFAATSIVFIWALTELGVPLMCDYTRVTSVQIFNGLKDIGRNPFVYALVVVLLVATLVIYGLTRAFLGRTHHLGPARGGRSRQPVRLSLPGGLLATTAVALVVVVAALPNVSVLLLAFAGDWYRTALPSAYTLEHVRSAIGHDLVVPSIANSLKYVTLSTVLDLALGTAIAYLVTQRRSRASRVLDAAAMLPLAVPGLVMAFGYLAISRDGRPLSFLNPGHDPTALLVIAYAVRRLPFVVRSAAAGFAQVSRTLEEAATNLGAGGFRTFVRITLPLIAPHLAAGAVFAFALSMLEVSDSLILAQRQATYPITKAIYELFQMLGDGRQVAAALGLWAMMFLASSTGFARALVGKRLGAIFRM